MNKKDVQEIRLLLRSKAPVKYIAKIYGIHKSTVYDIKNGDTWNPKRLETAKEIQREAVRGEKNHWAKLTEKDVKQIRKYLDSGEYSQNSIAKHYGVTSQLISLINLGKVWNHL